MRAFLTTTPATISPTRGGRHLFSDRPYQYHQRRPYSSVFRRTSAKPNTFSSFRTNDDLSSCLNNSNNNSDNDKNRRMSYSPDADDHVPSPPEFLLGLLNVSEIFDELESDPTIVNKACQILEQFILTESQEEEKPNKNNSGERPRELTPSRKRSLDNDNENKTAAATDTTARRDDGGTIEMSLDSLCHNAFVVSLIFLQLSDDSDNTGSQNNPNESNKAKICGGKSSQSSGKRRNNKQTWQRLQHAAQLLQTPYHTETSSASDKGKASSLEVSSQPSNSLAISLVFGSLALSDGGDDEAGMNGRKAAASALSSTVSRNKMLRHSGSTIASQILRMYLIHAAGQNDKNFFSTATSSGESIKSSSCQQFDLQILNHFAKSFKLSGDKCMDPHVTARAVENVLEIYDAAMKKQEEQVDMDVSTLFNDNGDEDRATNLLKQNISGALALACQLQPWSVLSPLKLVEAAIPFDLWHAAEEVCHSSYKFMSSSSSSSTLTKSARSSDINSYRLSTSRQKANVESAVRFLIQSAMDDRIYRRADTFATSLFDAGGWSMYVDARYCHACETISKVIKKRQMPIVDRQIDRVDKAVAKVASYISTSDAHTSIVTSLKKSTNLVTPTQISTTNNKDTSPSTQESSFSPSDEIRQFALRKIEESGDIGAAKRLASIHSIDYVYDERAIMLATAMRKRRYLQFEDVLDCKIPVLIDDPSALRISFNKFLKDPDCRGSYGFDAEWDEETSGAAILQIATMDQIILIDMLALKSTEDGIQALKETVGKLFGSENAVVLGFACKQDMSRLRASSGKDSTDNWLSAGTRAVVDLQKVIERKDRTLYKAGLSSVCEWFLGKPLDKSEQCSMWSERPLSESQRSYAALDAWTCVAIWERLQTMQQNT